MGAGCFHANAAVANQLRTGLQRDRQLKFEARLFSLLRQEPLNEFLDGGGGSFGPLVVAQIERFALIGQDIRPIARAASKGANVIAEPNPLMRASAIVATL